LILEVYDIVSFRTFFDVVYDTVSTIEFKLDPEKLKISLLNKAHTVFYDVEYDKEFFGDYVVDGAESVMIIADDLFKILKSASKNDTLIMESNEDYLICKFESENGNHRIFELPLALDEYNSPTPPVIDCDYSFPILLEDLKQSSTDLDKIVGSKNMRFKLVGSDLSILAGTDAMTNYVHTLEVEEDGNAEVTVSLEYINELLKFNKLNKVVELKIGDNIPLQYHITTPDELIRVDGLIAPIMSED